MTKFEEALSLLNDLSTLDKVRLMERLATSLESDLQERKPRKSLYGLLADLGTAPSSEDIDEIRREMWGNFPREEIF